MNLANSVENSVFEFGLPVAQNYLLLQNKSLLESVFGIVINNSMPGTNHGMIISRLAAGSTALQYGLIKPGDKLITISDVQITSVEQVDAILTQLLEKQERIVKFKVERYATGVIDYVNSDELSRKAVVAETAPKTASNLMGHLRLPRPFGFLSMAVSSSDDETNDDLKYYHPGSASEIIACRGGLITLFQLSEDMSVGSLTNVTFSIEHCKMKAEIIKADGMLHVLAVPDELYREGILKELWSILCLMFKHPGKALLENAQSERDCTTIISSYLSVLKQLPPVGFHTYCRFPESSNCLIRESISKYESEISTICSSFSGVENVLVFCRGSVVLHENSTVFCTMLHNESHALTSLAQLMPIFCQNESLLFRRAFLESSQNTVVFMLGLCVGKLTLVSLCETFHSNLSSNASARNRLFRHSLITAHEILKLIPKEESKTASRKQPTNSWARSKSVESIRFLPENRRSLKKQFSYKNVNSISRYSADPLYVLTNKSKTVFHSLFTSPDKEPFRKAVESLPLLFDKTDRNKEIGCSVELESVDGTAINANIMLNYENEDITKVIVVPDISAPSMKLLQEGKSCLLFS